jgi:hypothetical protein
MLHLGLLQGRIDACSTVGGSHRCIFDGWRVAALHLGLVEDGTVASPAGRESHRCILDAFLLLGSIFADLGHPQRRSTHLIHRSRAGLNWCRVASMHRRRLEGRCFASWAAGGWYHGLSGRSRVAMLHLGLLLQGRIDASSTVRGSLLCILDLWRMPCGTVASRAGRESHRCILDAFLLLGSIFAD